MSHGQKSLEGSQFTGSQRVRHSWASEHTHAHISSVYILTLISQFIHLPASPLVSICLLSASPVVHTEYVGPGWVTAAAPIRELDRKETPQVSPQLHRIRNSELGLSIMHFNKVILRPCEVRATGLNREQLAVILRYSQLYSLINLNLVIFLTLPSQLLYFKEFQAKTNPWFLKIKLFFWP